MEFYIYNGTQWEQVYVEVEPKLTRAFDTTNDSFACTLKATTNEEPYKPMTPFKIIDDNNQTRIMWIINDSVEIFTLKPLTYKHILSIVQYRYFLNKHLTRNTVFNQPRKRTYSLYGALTTIDAYNSSPSFWNFKILADPNLTDNRPMMWTDTLKIGVKTRVKSISYFITMFASTVVDNSVYSRPIGAITDDDGCRIKEHAQFYIYDNNRYDKPRIIENLWIKDFDRRIALTDSQINTLNTYLNGVGHADLRIGYDSGESGGTVFTNSFAERLHQNTIAFSNLVAQISFRIELYNYTMYDVLDDLLKQHRLSFYGGNHKREKLFELPESGELYDLLKTTYPPDTLSFTQATWYEVLQEIFRFYDAGFWFDENKVLQIEYYNNPKKDVSSTKLTGRNLSFADKNYNNGKVAYYQNAVNETKIPILPTRCETFGVPGKSDYGIVLPYPIYDITRLDYICYFSGTLPIDPNGDANLKKFNFNHQKLDLTYFLVNSEIWTSLPKTNTISGSIYDLKQMATIPFQRGSKFIGVSNYDKNYGVFSFAVLGEIIRGAICRFFGFPNWDAPNTVTSSFLPGATDYKDQKFSIEYLTENNGRFTVESLVNKYDGEELNNQNNGGVDVSKLGLNIFGETLKNGVPTLSANIQISKWDKRIKEGDYIVYNNEKWMANIVTYTAIREDVYVCSVEFSKDFNALSLRVRSDKEKRLTEISRNLAVMSEDNFIDYVYVGIFPFYRGDPLTNTTLDKYVIEGMVGMTFGIGEQWYNVKNIDYGAVLPYDENGNAITYTGEDGIVSKYLYIPIIKYGAGNCVCFEMQYNDPMNAGNRLTYGNVWGNVNRYFSQATPYTDENGWAKSFDIKFIYSPYTMISETNNFPIVDETYLTNNQLVTAGQIRSLQYYKKPNEIFGLNYELCFLPLDKDNFFIGSDFINHNIFVDENVKNKEFYLYYSTNDNDKYSILDKKGILGSGITRKPLSFNTNSGQYYVVLYVLTPTFISATSWSICDEEGNIYFASNTPMRFDTTKEDTACKIYFMTSKHRMTGNTLYDLGEPYEPSGTIQFKVHKNDWITIPNVWSINIDVSVQPNNPNVVGTHNIDGSTTYIYSFSDTTLTLVNKTLDELYIEKGQGMDDATVSFTSSTGTFTGTITLTVPPNVLPTSLNFKAIIRYQVHGETGGRSIYRYSVSDQALVGANYTQFSISPSSVVISGNTVENTVTFNPATGTFTGQVNIATAHNETYTITYS